jgi:hypothetical protein
MYNFKIPRDIIMRFVIQSKCDGFIRFKDGNRVNYCRNNIEKITTQTALNSINSNEVTDWDVSFNNDERTIIKNNKNLFIKEINEFNKY